jgi:hypothetical protein
VPKLDEALASVTVDRPLVYRPKGTLRSSAQAPKGTVHKKRAAADWFGSSPGLD